MIFNELQITLKHKNHPTINTRVTLHRDTEWGDKQIKDKIAHYTEKYCDVNKLEKYRPEDIDASYKIEQVEMQL